MAEQLWCDSLIAFAMVASTLARTNNGERMTCAVYNGNTSERDCWSLFTLAVSLPVRFCTPSQRAVTGGYSDHSNHSDRLSNTGGKFIAAAALVG